MDEHMLNDLLECSVCLERLDTSSKVLPCQHTFCRKCLEVIVSSHQQLRCPECRVLVDVKIDDLPPNVLLMRILEGMKNAAANKTQQQQHITMHLIETSRLKNINKQNDDNNQQQHERLKTNEQHLQQQLQYQKQQQYLQQKKLQQQQAQTNQHNTQTPLVINPSSETSNQQHVAAPQLQPQQQQRQCILPHAYAMHEFKSSETTDLRFKKGDLILLKRKIDDNWYVGQANGTEGTFPINYVKVIVPLPIAQCIALYDFKMGPNEEEGCLSFKKGAIIHVLRRVDQNWAEGRLNNTIGIFPIAFVRLNALAEQMLANKIQTVSHQPDQLNITEQLNLNNLPLSITTTNSTTATTTTTTNNNFNNNNNNFTTITLSSTSSPTSTQHSTATTTASNSCNSSKNNSNDNSLNNSPMLSEENTPQHIPKVTNVNDDVQEMVAGAVQDVVQLRYREGHEKRHSLNALLNSNSTENIMATSVNAQRNVLQTNRHSAEILSTPHENEINNISQQQHENIQNINIAMPQSTIAREQQQQQPQQIQTRCNVLKSPIIVQQQMIPPTLPWGYLALYPYKPRKNDELELKKGCVYIVTERCLDGWFKGKNWQDTLGVFPGNYVTPLRPRDQKQLMHQWKHVPLISMAPMSNITTTTTTITTNTHRNNILPILQIPPPDAPPRQVASVTPSSLPSPSSSTTTCASVWTKPLGHTVEAFFNRHNNINNIGNSDKSLDKNKESMTALTNNLASGTVSNSSTTTTSTCTAVSLMKRLTSMKSRSKSPATSATAKNLASNHQQDEAKPNAQHPQLQTIHPVHVRSGSCPSQLLQNLPKTQLKPQQPQPLASNEHILYALQHNLQQQQQQQRQQENLAATASTFTYGGSQRLKGCKERPSLQNARQSLDSNIFRNAYHNLHYQQQQQQQQNQEQQSHVLINNQLTTSAQPAQPINHRKSQSLDANTLLRTHAASNLQLPIMSNSNMPMSTTSTLATNSKSAQNLPESRFRCIVPYPPNSEFELELHLGDIIYVHRKLKNGWFKGTCARTNKTGFFPASFVELDS